MIHGYERAPTIWQAGDIMSMRLTGGLPHIAILSDRMGPQGQPLAIHNIGRGVHEEPLIDNYGQQRRFSFLPMLPT